MGIQSQSTLIASMILIGLSIHVYNDRRSIKFRKTFIVLLASLSFVNAMWFLFLVSDNENWLIGLSFGALFFAQVSRRFFQRFTRSTSRTLTQSLNAISVGWLSLLGFDLFFDSKLVLNQVVLGITAMSTLLTYAFCLWRLFLRRRIARSKTESTRLGYLIAGGVLTLTLTFFDILDSMNYDVPALGHLSFTVYMYFWMQIVLRSRLLDLKEVLGRGLSMLSLSTLVTIIYILMLAWVGNRSELLLFNTFAASVLVFFTFEPLKRFTDTLVNRLLFHPTFALMKQLRLMRHQLRATMTQQELTNAVINNLNDSKRFTHISLFMTEGTAKNFICLGTIGPVQSRKIGLENDHIFLEQIADRRILSTDRLHDELNELGESVDDVALKSDIEHILSTMDRMHANVSLALISERRLIGIVNLADQRSLEPFSSVEIDKIANAALSVSAAFASSNSVQRMRHQERLSAVGEMATGMAHEIRNPLGAIKSAAQLLSPSTRDPDSDTMLNIIIDEANRLDHVLSDFLLFARPSRADLGPLELIDLLSRIITLVTVEVQTIEIELRAPESLPQVLGNRDQIHQVCLNLLRNAIQATGEGGGKIEIEVELVTERLAGTLRQRVRVSFIDHGDGIPEDDIKKLFVPFFTTKQKGTGLGLPISQRLLGHHGSKIDVFTQTGIGTRMSFDLFLFDDGVRHTSETQLLPPSWVES
jgi:two-component system, NtrC family, sensor histidine kinase HydH